MRGHGSHLRRLEAGVTPASQCRPDMSRTAGRQPVCPGGVYARVGWRLHVQRAGIGQRPRADVVCCAHPCSHRASASRYVSFRQFRLIQTGCQPSRSTRQQKRGEQSQHRLCQMAYASLAPLVYSLAAKRAMSGGRLIPGPSQLRCTARVCATSTPCSLCPFLSLEALTWRMAGM